HEPLVEDQVEDVGEPARARGTLEVVARRAVGRDSHRFSLARDRLLALAATLRALLPLALALLCRKLLCGRPGDAARPRSLACDRADPLRRDVLGLGDRVGRAAALLELRHDLLADQPRRLACEVGGGAADGARGGRRARSG